MTFEAPLWMQNNGYAARLDRMLMAQLWDEGVMDLAAFKVTQRGAGANFSVDVAAGEVVIAGDDQTNQGNYLARSIATINAAITAAPGANSRYDLVCIRINDPNAGGSAGNTASIVVTAGTPAASPAVPATPASSLPIAIIGPISTGVASITNAIITDARVLAGRRDTPGTIEWSANTAPANGWLFCAGQAVSRTTYARLFAHLSTTFGAGDGATTFNLPDLRGRAVVGLDNMNGTDAGRLSVANALGGSGGAETHTLSAAELAVHAHSIDHDHGSQSISASVTINDNTTDLVRRLGTAAGNQAVSGVSWNGGSFNLMQDSGGSFANVTAFMHMDYITEHGHTGTVTGTVDLPNFTSSSGNAGSGSAHNNMQPYTLLNAFIRT